MIDFKTYDDEKLIDFIHMWEVCVQTRILNPYSVYVKAQVELMYRNNNMCVSDEQAAKIYFFEKYPNDSIEEFQRWYKLCLTGCNFNNDDN